MLSVGLTRLQMPAAKQQMPSTAKRRTNEQCPPTLRPSPAGTSQPLFSKYLLLKKKQKFKIPMKNYKIHHFSSSREDAQRFRPSFSLIVG
jgi:hypothetical protein